jgi:hypothetical protein
MSHSNYNCMSRTAWRSLPGSENALYWLGRAIWNRTFAHTSLRCWPRLHWISHKRSFTGAGSISSPSSSVCGGELRALTRFSRKLGIIFPTCSTSGAGQNSRGALSASLLVSAGGVFRPAMPDRLSKAKSRSAVPLRKPDYLHRRPLAAPAPRAATRPPRRRAPSRTRADYKENEQASLPFSSRNDYRGKSEHFLQCRTQSTRRRKGPARARDVNQRARKSAPRTKPRCGSSSAGGDLLAVFGREGSGELSGEVRP